MQVTPPVYPMKALPLEIYSYLTERCKVLGWKRSELTRRLGYANVSRALRNYDAFCEGNLEQQDLLHRLMLCQELAGEEFDAALRLSRDRLERDTNVAIEVATLREEQYIEQARGEHIPHLWLEHECTRPKSLFSVIWGGIESHKLVVLPEDIIHIKEQTKRLEAVQNFVKTLTLQYTTGQGTFGEVTSVLFRDSYDHSFDINLQGQLIAERHRAPWRGKIKISSRPHCANTI